MTKQFLSRFFEVKQCKKEDSYLLNTYYSERNINVRNFNQFGEFF